MSVAELDEAKKGAFAERMLQMLNDACLGLMAGLGHESGLFDVMAGLAPSSSEEIARAAGLNERYVREWLGPMVTGGVVDYDPERAGIDVLDIGCGQGHAVNVLARAFPAGRFHGLDKSEEGVAAARAEAAAWGLANSRFEVGDSAELTGSYDLVTAFDVIHDLARPAQTLAAVRGALRQDGVFLMGDIAASSRLEENIGHPLCPALYTFSVFYCMSVSLSEGGAGLGTVWGEQTAQEMLAAAGFGHVDAQRVEGDILNVYYVARR